MPPFNPSNLKGFFYRPVVIWSASIILIFTLIIMILGAFGISIFRQIGMPHEFCYLRDPRLVWMHVISDLLIGAAYVSISSTLGYLVYKASKGIPFHWIFLAFGLFIISCGLTHFMEVWVIWQPVYWLSGYIKIITAAASVATALALFPLVPKIFALIDAASKSEKRRIEIEQLNQELERFNYSVAHDLRAPLRGISGFCQALREELPSEVPPEATMYMERIQGSVGRMEALISALLKYATIGRQAIRLEPVSLEAVLEGAKLMLSDDIDVKKAEVITMDVMPKVKGDETLLQVVFCNLIGNALKFVSPGTIPRVEITVEKAGASIIVRFTDNGLGLPAESADRLFGMFERFHPQIKGTGIGLAITQRALERIGGRIGVSRSPKSQGSQFWIELPAV